MMSTYETHTGSPSLERIFLVTVRWRFYRGLTVNNKFLNNFMQMRRALLTCTNPYHNFDVIFQENGVFRVHNKVKA